MPKQTIYAADLFCGAGGTSTGLRKAAETLSKHLKLVAVNHWPMAIKTHSANHPDAEHRCTNLDNVDPRNLVPGGKLDLLVASPECTHHSQARGGRPINDQSRASAWRVTEWVSQLDYVKHILIENVPEFETWGPLNAKGRPIKARKGELFRAFIDSLKAHGYKVDWKVLTAADYGDPTTRKRIFIQARRGNKPIVWPEPTHVPPDKLEAVSAAFPSRRFQPYKSAREIIDWGIPGKSIFDRKKPLAPNTMARIWKGIEKFVGEPFILPQHSCGANRSLDDPLPAIMTDGAHALCCPFIVVSRNNVFAQSVDDPLLPARLRDRAPESGQSPPFVISTNRGAGDFRGYDLGNPFPTISSVDALATINQCLVKFYGTAEAASLDDPIDTIPTKDLFRLAEPRGFNLDGATVIVDVLFRMLQPHELAAAMSFPVSYSFAGTREQKVKQIGNAVPVGTAEALCHTILTHL